MENVPAVGDDIARTVEGEAEPGGPPPPWRRPARTLGGQRRKPYNPRSPVCVPYSQRQRRRRRTGGVVGEVQGKPVGFAVRGKKIRHRVSVGINRRPDDFGGLGHQIPFPGEVIFFSYSPRLSRPAGLLGAASFRSFAWSLSEEAFAEVWSQLKKVLISVVYGSNLIESAGQDLPITIKICQDVFDGKEVDPNIPEHDPEYKQHLENLLKTYRKCDMPNVIRSRLEVINHAKALNYMSNKVVLNNEEVSEAFILQTHRILLEGVGGDIEPGVS